jgi:hypothetical protein
MSGSNSGEGSSFGGGAPTVDCESVSIKTRVVSPDPAVLTTLNIGDFLSITLRTSTGPLIATTIDGSILGAVFTTNPTLLIECINKGHSYQAEILAISGGDCQILITTE